jgi:hypothetical protein
MKNEKPKAQDIKQVLHTIRDKYTDLKLQF